MPPESSSQHAEQKEKPRGKCAATAGVGCFWSGTYSSAKSFGVEFENRNEIGYL
jgi:hypothetical protein